MRSSLAFMQPVGCLFAAFLLSASAHGQTQSVALATGVTSSCAITTTGAVKCWGYSFGTLGDGGTMHSFVPVDVAGLPSGAARVSMGLTDACVVTALGAAKCWGDRLALSPDFTIVPAPIDIVGLGSGVTDIAVGMSFACAVVDGGLKCWGDNDDGQLGIGNAVYQSVPMDVPGLGSGVQAIAAGPNHACAIVTGGLLKCWGSNERGQLGDGTTIKRLSPVDVVVPGGPVVAVSAGPDRTCAVTAAGAAWCWGENSRYQLGDGTLTNRLVPTPVSGLESGVATISTGTYHTCAQMIAGGAKCWGDNLEHALGVEGLREAPTPVDYPTPAGGLAVIVAGRDVTCTVSAIGGVMCSGRNIFGGLGDGTARRRTIPVSVHGLNDVDGDAMTNDIEVIEGTDPLTKDNDVFANARLFVRQQYRDFLFREGDPAGIDGWAAAIAAGSHSRERVVDAFFNSREFDEQVGWLVRLYLAAFQRPPDRAGLAHNSGLGYVSNLDPIRIADHFATSPEFKSLWGTLDNTQFVMRLYRDVLGREPDPAGLEGWVTALQNGASRGVVLLGFSEPPEFRANSTNDVLAIMFYLAMLDLPVDPGGRAAWVSFLGLAPYLHEQAIQAVMQTATYRARFLP